MLKKMILAVIAVFCVTACNLSNASSIDMKDGSWEVTMTAEMPNIPGMPAGMSMPPMVYTACMTKDDCVPPTDSQQGESTCTDVKTNINGNTVTWSIDCSSEGGDMHSEGSITYKGDTFEGAIKSTMTQMNMTMTSTMSGRYLGPCE